MNKRVLLILSLALTVLYAAISAAGYGVSGEYGGIFYRLIIIAALIYTCVCIFFVIVKKGVTDTLMGAALGLGTFAVNELYSFAYIYLLQGGASDITVGNYSRNCAYLFWMAAVFSLLPSFNKVLRTVVSTLSAGAILLVFYGVVAGNSALAVALLCILPAVYLTVKGDKTAKAFGLAVIAAGVLDSANRLMILFDPGLHWRDIILAFYPAVYLALGFASLCVAVKERGEAVS
ncbi:hypothetical protein FACS1894219_09220 [Clostridia bacterium]|nr:hypothetical protein FACS1894219_09220 [Clostridia bacterium]